MQNVVHSFVAREEAGAMWDGWDPGCSNLHFISQVSGGSGCRWLRAAAYSENKAGALILTVKEEGAGKP